MRPNRRLILVVAALLTAAPFPAYALEQEDIDSLGRVLGATNEAVSRFGEAGETLKNFGKNDFVGAGTGSVKRGLARGWNEALQPWKDASQAVRDGVSFKIVGRAFQISDYVTPIGSATAGDVRGTVSGVTQIVVGGQATAGGAALFGAIGTGAGAVVGSFFPVVGNIVGAEVGGAIGMVAGGFISAYGYDKYLKDTVGAGVEGGFAAVFDVDPLQQAMRARQAFLHQNLSPEIADQLKTSLSFGGGEAQIVDWERVPYVVTPKQPPQTPPDQQQAALPPAAGDLLAGVKKIEIDGRTTCTIDNGQVNCIPPPADIGSAVRKLSHSLAGTVTGNTLDLEFRAAFEANDGRCTASTIYRGRLQVALEAGGRSVTASSMTITSTGTCAKSFTRTGSSTAVGTWRVLQ